jgi:hypothetical protein
MMPGLNGYEVLPRLRERKIWTLEMMLTAKDGDYDQTDAFDLGAEDYMTKPFSFMVLRARLRALVRRGAPERPAILSVGSLTVDPALRRAACNGTEIRLTVKEFALLEYLARNAVVGPSGAAGWDRTGLVKGWAVGTAADSLRALEQVTLSINAGGDVVCALGRTRPSVEHRYRGPRGPITYRPGDPGSRRCARDVERNCAGRAYHRSPHRTRSRASGIRHCHRP